MRTRLTAADVCYFSFIKLSRSNSVYRTTKLTIYQTVIRTLVCHILKTKEISRLGKEILRKIRVFRPTFENYWRKSLRAIGVKEEKG